MANTLSQRQKQDVLRMKKLGILKKLAGHRIPPNRKLVLCVCSDADRHGLTVKTLLDAIQLPDNGGERSFHIMAENGGPVRGDTEHPLSRIFPTRVLDYVVNVLIGCVLKGCNTIVLCPHGVCGLEHTLGRETSDTLLSVIHLKETIRMFLRTPGFMEWMLGLMGAHHPLTESQLAFALELPGNIKIPIFMEFDFGGKKPVIYYVSAKEWRKHHANPHFTPTLHIPTL